MIWHCRCSERTARSSGKRGSCRKPKHPKARHMVGDEENLHERYVRGWRRPDPSTRLSGLLQTTEAATYPSVSRSLGPTQMYNSRHMVKYYAREGPAKPPLSCLTECIRSQILLQKNASLRTGEARRLPSSSTSSEYPECGGRISKPCQTAVEFFIAPWSAYANVRNKVGLPTQLNNGASCAHIQFKSIIYLYRSEWMRKVDLRKGHATLKNRGRCLSLLTMKLCERGPDNLVRRLAEKRFKFSDPSHW